MELTISGKLRELKFDMKFVRRMDEFYKYETEGFAMGMGVSMGEQALKMYSITDLAKIVRCAVEGSPTILEVDKCIEEFAEENGSLEPLFDELIESMGKSPLLKATIEGFKKLNKQK